MKKEIFYVEWFIISDPIKFFDSKEEAEKFSHSLYETMCERSKGFMNSWNRRYDEFCALGKILPSGKKELIMWFGYGDEMERYKVKIEKEFEQFNNIQQKAVEFYEKIGNPK